MNHQTKDDSDEQNTVSQLEMDNTSETDKQYFQITSPFVKPMHQIEVEDENETPESR